MNTIYFDKLNIIRKSKKVSLTEISEKTGISRSTVWKWEKGISEPKSLHIRAIAKLLDVDVSEISNLPPEKSFSEKNLSESVETWFEFAESGLSEENTEFKLIGDTLKKLQTKLNNSAIMIKGLMNATNSYLYIKGTDSKYIIANKHFKLSLGLKEEYKIYGKEDKDFFSSKEAASNDSEDRNIMLLGNPVINQERLIPGSRRKKWGLVSKFPILDSRNKVQGIIGIIVDITERKNNEELRELLEVNVNSMSEGVVIVNSDNNEFIYLNCAIESIYGYPTSTLLKKGANFWLDNVVHPDDRSKEKQYIDMKSWPKTRTFRIIKPDNNVRWIESVYSQTVFMGQKCYFLIQRDVTEKVRAKKAEERYIQKIKDMESSLFNLPYLVYVHKKSGDTMAVRNSDSYYTNGNEYLILGLTQEEIYNVDKNWVNFILPGYRDKIVSILNSNKKNVEMEYPIKCPKTDKIRWLKEAYTVYSDKVCGIVHDITNLKVIGGIN